MDWDKFFGFIGDAIAFIICIPIIIYKIIKNIVVNFPNTIHAIWTGVKMFIKNLPEMIHIAYNVTKTFAINFPGMCRDIGYALKLFIGFHLLGWFKPVGYQYAYFIDPLTVVCKWRTDDRKIHTVMQTFSRDGVEIIKQ